VNILVVAPNWLGDVVMALPAIADVRRHFAGATLTIAARAPLAALAALVPGVDETIALEGGRGARIVATLRRNARRLRAGRFDATLLLPNSFHAALVAFGARIPERWGYRTDCRAPMLTRAVARPRAPRMHQAEYYQHLTSALGFPAGPLRAEICVDARHRADADRLLRAHGWDGGPLVGIAPGAAYGSAKRWLPDRMGAVAARLARDGHASVVLVGADADRDTVEIVTRTASAEGAAPGRVLNLAGKTDLPVLAGVLSRCRAFVSNDSGAMHLAAAVDVPVVAIFGPTREWATSPLPGPSRIETAIVRTDVPCRPCMLRTCPIDHRCMTRIAVDDVMAPVMVAVQRTPATRETP
jgi:lipopolysaccharide heptosyltransferase II